MSHVDEFVKNGIKMKRGSGLFRVLLPLKHHFFYFSINLSDRQNVITYRVALLLKKNVCRNSHEIGRLERKRLDPTFNI